MTVELQTGPGGKMDVSVEELYDFLREYLTANEINIAHSVENFDALINTFFGRDENFVWSTDRMDAHFEEYRREDGTIDPQAAEDINAYLADIGVEGGFDASYSTDSGGPETPSETPAAPGVGSGVLGGGQLTKIERPGQDPLYAMVYRVGGIEHVYAFDSEESMYAILGDNAFSEYGLATMPWETVNDGDTWLLGSAEAFAGQEGGYAQYWEDIQREAALEAGSRDPGRLGRIMSDPDIMRIVAEAEVGDWSDERMWAEIRRTDGYKAVYPGIDTFISAGYANPEQEWRRYQNSVQSSLELMGYERDPDGSYDSATGTLLEAGISVDELNNFAPVFARAESSQDYAAVLNQWVEAETGQPLTFEDWVDVLADTTTAEMADIVERATIQFQAERTGTTLDQATISRLAELTGLSEAQMVGAFSQAEEALLAVGNNELARYGLSQEALVNSAFGVETIGADPLSTDDSPLSAGEVRQRASKAATELGLRDDQKDTFFIGFDKHSRPQRQGLTAMRPEVG